MEDGFIHSGKIEYVDGYNGYISKNNNDHDESNY